MEILVKAGQFLLSLSFLIVLHELGHFIPARLFKTRVEKFFLFFDIKGALWQKKIGETVYGIGWLPLGGYVKIAGMIDESMDKEQMAKPAQPWEFRIQARLAAAHHHARGRHRQPHPRRAHLRPRLLRLG